MKKTISVGVATVLLVGSLSACSTKGATTEGKSRSAPSASATASKPHDPVKLSIQNGYSSNDEAWFMDNFGKKIQEKFPYISFEYSAQKDLKNRVTSGGEIDIELASAGGTPTSVLDYNLQYDISPLIAKYKYDLSRLQPTAVEQQRNFANGGIYGLPVNAPSFALFYNKSLFDKFGVEYPKDGMTWDDVYNIAKKVSRTEGDKNYYGFGMSVYHMMRLNPFSLPYLDPKTNRPLFADDNFKQLVETFTPRFTTIPGNQQNDWVQLFSTVSKFTKTQNMAMMFYSLDTILQPGYQEPFKMMNWDMTDVPTFKELPGVGLQPYPLYFYIPTISKHKDDAFQVLEYLTSDEFQLWQSKRGFLSILNNRSILEAFGEDADVLKGKNRKALVPKSYAKPAPFNKYNSVAESSLIVAIDAIAKGQKDINTALRDAVDSANAAVKKAQSQ